ncbi:MAG: PmbA/TldA family metallopeptidase, partial [Planctomycetota bacterium]
MTGREAALEVLDLARAAGVSAEAFYGRSSQLQIRCFEGKVEHLGQAEGGGLGVRVVRDGRTGTAYTEALSAESVEETFRAATGAVEHLSPQEGVLLSDWPAPPEVEGLEAPEIAELATDAKIEMALAAESAARSLGPEILNVPWTGYSENSGEVFLANTEGLERSRRAACANMHVQALAARGEERKSYFDFCMARRVADFDPEKLG